MQIFEEGKMKKKIIWLLVCSSMILFVSCGGGGSSSDSNTGNASVSLTDAPAFGYDNVWVTVKEIWFHTDDTVGPGDAAWLKYVVTPYTVDLLTLCNGAISPAIWDQIKLPIGTYKQIRILLAKTTDSLTASATAQGLSYNNEVVTSTGVSPLYIPDAEHGIRLAGTFTISASTPLRLAIDFNAGDDIVAVTRRGVTEYYLKPRLAYFDLDNAGTIVGTIDNTAEANNSTAQFVFKAETPDPTGSYHVVKRYSVYDTTNNQFVIYPLPPGNYDVMMRGIGYETVIVKSVPVTRGTTPTSGATIIPTITMTADLGANYNVTANGMSPTGSWVNFYQTLPGAGEIPYEIRYRHLDPLHWKLSRLQSFKHFNPDGDVRQQYDGPNLECVYAGRRLGRVHGGARWHSPYP